MNNLKANKGMLTDTIGGDGGDHSIDPSQLIKSIGLDTDIYVDKIIINNTGYGGNGGMPRQSIQLRDGEYINKVVVKYGECIDNIEFTTNKGNIVSGGGNGGSYTKTFENIRLVAIGGKYGHYLDAIKLTYASDYVASSVVENNANFILDFIPPGTTVELSEVEHDTTFLSYLHTVDYMLDMTINASVESEFIDKVSLATKLETKYSDLTTIKSELTEEVTHSEKKIYVCGAGEVRLIVASCTIMKNADDSYWMFPNGGCTYPLITTKDVAQIAGFYALPGAYAGLKVQMDNFDSTMVNGFNKIKVK